MHRRAADPTPLFPSAASCLTAGTVALALLGACARPEARGGVKQLTLTPEQRWASADEGPEAFAEVRSFGVDRGGRMYILDAQAQVVHVFEPTGAHLRTIGRKGAGPGEFNQANGLVVGADDRLWVYDHANQRITQFDTAGQLIKVHPLRIRSYGYIWEGGIDPEGRILDDIYIPVSADSGRSAVERTDLASGRTDTLAMPRCKADRPGFYKFPRGNMSIPYAARRYYRIDPRGYSWCGDMKQASVFQYHLGDTIPFRQFGVQVEPAPVTPAGHDSAAKHVTDFAKQVGGTDVDLSLIPKVKPLLQRVDVDDRGQVWMQIEEKRGFRMVVFDSTGVEVAEGPAPFGVSYWPLIIRGDALYAVTRDSMDVQSVVRYRVR